MEEKLNRKALRRQLAPVSRSLVLYFILMNVVVSLVLGLDAAVRFAVLGQYPNLGAALSAVSETNYWGYLLASLIGFLILLGWKGSRFLREEIFRPNREMKLSTIIALAAWMLVAQAGFNVFNEIVDSILGIWGLSTDRAEELATMVVTSPSMFLYACIAAPICEELLFRGLILRLLMPYGKKTAVFLSALLFGLFHGNLVQSPFAFCVGFIFAYTAVEYNIVWAMVLHMGNNLFLGDTLLRILGVIPEYLGIMLQALLVYGFGISMIVLTIMKRKSIVSWFRENRMNYSALGALFQCPSMIILTIFTVASMVATVMLGG